MRSAGLRRASFLLLAGAAAWPGTGPAAADAPRAQAGSPEFARWADDIEILRTRSGVPVLRLNARRSITDTRGTSELIDVTVRLYASDGSETVVEAPRARSFQEEAPETPASGAAAPSAAAPSSSGSVGSWILEDGVTIRSAGGLVATTRTLAVLEPSGVARTREPLRFVRGPLSGESEGFVYTMGERFLRFPGRLRAEMSASGMGKVRIAAASGLYELKGDLFQAADYRVLTERGESLAGARLEVHFSRDDGVLTRLEGESGFTLQTTHAIPAAGEPSVLSRLLALEGRRELRGDRLAILFDAGTPSSVLVTGKANLTALPDRTAGPPASLAAETLRIDLASGTVSRVSAAGGVDLRGTRASAEDPGFHLDSDRLEASMEPDGSLKALEGAGEIRLTDRGLESEGARATLDPNTDIVTLTGEGERPAVATWLGRRIEARQRIELDRKKRTLSAAGGVRASYRSDPSADASSGASGVPFFDASSTIYVMAGRLTLAEQGSAAQYREHVRLWQGENRVEASEVDVYERQGRLEARGSVVSAFRPGRVMPPPGSSANVEEPITVAAETMRFDRESHLVTYGGSVQVTRGATRIASKELKVLLSPDGSRAESLEATGAVSLRDPGRVGHGDRLVLDLKSEATTLTGIGREAIIQDESGQQVVKGSSLTMERGGDRILVESERAGRSWITLKPRPKGAPGVDSNPRN